MAETNNNIPNKKCKRIRRELSIMYDGKIPVCGPQTKFSDCEYLGDIRSNSIYEIWNNSRMTYIRELLKKKNYDTLPKCRKCIYFR